MTRDGLSDSFDSLQKIAFGVKADRDALLVQLKIAVKLIDELCDHADRTADPKTVARMEDAIAQAEQR